MHVIENLQKYAEKFNGKCLSTVYKTNDTVYEWECEDGHQFTKTWTTLLRKDSIFCKECKKQNNINLIQKYAIKNKGKCLSIKYNTSSTEYDFICENNHNFKKTWTECKRGKWFCIKCHKDNEITIEKLKNFAKEKGGECLSKIYINSYTNYKWKCGNEHIWNATWVNIGYNNATWCPDCPKWTFEEIQDYVEMKRNGGKCLKLVEGTSITGKYLFECEDLHQWVASASSIINNDTWCSECLKLTIEDCHKEAEMRGGLCLDDIYINRREEINWQCGKGHVFKSPLGRVRNNDSWCRECALDELRHDISYAHELAKKKNGECLSTEYINLVTPMMWKCENGHVWSTALQCIKNDSWCLKCKMRKRRDKALERMQRWANLMGGKVLTKKEDIPYDIDCKLINITAECSKNHIWTRTLQVFFNGTWCPDCRFKSESKCRDIFEELLDTQFIKRRFECMEYLELDGYSEDYELAFEYNGVQHEKYIEFFHRNEQGFLDQQERDKRKLELCEKNNIDLIIIPSIYDYTKPKKLKNFIYQELVKKSYIIDKIRVTPPNYAF